MKQIIQIKMQDNSSIVSGLDSIKITYKPYSKSVKQPVDYKLFMLIAYTFFDEFKKALIEGMNVRLFSDIGNFSIIKRKVNLKKLKPDWKETKKLWERNPQAKEDKKLIYHLNQHTKGYYYKILWVRGYIKNITSYSFKPVRQFQRDLSHTVKTGNVDYINS